MPGQPGRNCPLSYRYTPGDLRELPGLPAETLYVVGGLYGNPAALAEVERIADRETGDVTVVFNGDFNWFNATVDGFRAINERVLTHTALRGNVETELCMPSPDAGCGCAYPDTVGQEIVDRSNAIMGRLWRAGEACPDILPALEELPRFAVARVSDQRIGIVHGDGESLAGWRFSAENLHNGIPDSLHSWFDEANVAVFACSHTCLPTLRTAGDGNAARAVVNNGAAGMPNFAGRREGVITRISTNPARNALYGVQIGDLHVDALAVPYDHALWWQQFVDTWPAGSAADLSYAGRLLNGPEYHLSQAQPPAGATTAGDADTRCA